MTRMLLAAVTSSVLALAAPAVAEAHHGKHHHGAHASVRRHRHHHATQAHVVSFGTPAQTTSPPPTNTTTSSGADAGTIKSFEKGVLTITLNEGSTVSGQVTENTYIRCQSTTSGWAQGRDRNGDGWRDGGDWYAGNQQYCQMCTTASLVSGAVVREAALSVTSAGAVWEFVELAP